MTLLVCTLKLNPSAKIDWSFQEVIQYNFHDKTNFGKYREGLDCSIKNINFNQFSTLSAQDMLQHITNIIKNVAKETFGIKIKKKRGRKLPRELLDLIKQKSTLTKLLSKKDVIHLNDPDKKEVERIKENLLSYLMTLALFNMDYDELFHIDFIKKRFVY